MTEENNAMTAEAAQQIEHAHAAIGNTLKTLIDSGMEPAALATALGGQFVNFISLTAAMQELPRAELMPRVVEAVQALEPFALSQYDRVRAEMDTKKADDANEQQ
jgi:hypothetical protein